MISENAGLRGSDPELDLFSDNRRTILLNDAGAMLRSLDLEKAISVHAGSRDNSPGDRKSCGFMFDCYMVKSKVRLEIW
jgi:hypothetical protein